MKQRFLFHGEVIPFGARLRGGCRSPLPAAVALPGVGGHARAHVDSFTLGRRLCIDHASSSVTGAHRDGGYETRVTCTVEGFRIAGVLEADLLSSVLTSRYEKHHRFYEETVVVEGLRIAGEPYRIDSTNLKAVQACPTWQMVGEALQKKKDMAESFAQAGTPAKGGVPVPTEAGDYACYLLQAHRAGAAPVAGPCASVHIGNRRFEIFLAEYLISERQRRLTLLRIEAADGEDRAVPVRAPAPPGGQAMALMASGPAADEEPDDESMDSASAGESRINGQTHP